MLYKHGQREWGCSSTWKATLDRILLVIWWMIWALRLPLLSMSPTMTGKNCKEKAVTLYPTETSRKQTFHRHTVTLAQHTSAGPVCFDPTYVVPNL